MRTVGFWQVDADQKRERPRAEAAGNPAPAIRVDRDDLRLIIDSTMSEQYGEATLADLIAPQRHRPPRLFETPGVQCTWELSALEQYALPAGHSLDMMRILQDALAIVMNRGDLGRPRFCKARVGDWQVWDANQPFKWQFCGTVQ